MPDEIHPRWQMFKNRSAIECRRSSVLGSNGRLRRDSSLRAGWPAKTLGAASIRNHQRQLPGVNLVGMYPERGSQLRHRYTSPRTAVRATLALRADRAISAENARTDCENRGAGFGLVCRFIVGAKIEARRLLSVIIDAPG